VSLGSQWLARFDGAFRWAALIAAASVGIGACGAVGYASIAVRSPFEHHRGMWHVPNTPGQSALGFILILAAPFAGLAAGSSFLWALSTARDWAEDLARRSESPRGRVRVLTEAGSVNVDYLPRVKGRAAALGLAAALAIAGSALAWTVGFTVLAISLAVPAGALILAAIDQVMLSSKGLRFSAAAGRLMFSRRGLARWDRTFAREHIAAIDRADTPFRRQALTVVLRDGGHQRLAVVDSAAAGTILSSLERALDIERPGRA